MKKPKWPQADQRCGVVVSACEGDKFKSGLWHFLSPSFPVFFVLYFKEKKGKKWQKARLILVFSTKLHKRVTREESSLKQIFRFKIYVSDIKFPSMCIAQFKHKLINLVWCMALDIYHILIINKSDLFQSHTF